MKLFASPAPEAKRLLSALAASYEASPNTRKMGGTSFFEHIAATLPGRLRWADIGGLSAEDHMALEQAWYGLDWAFATGRLSAATEKAIRALSGYRLLCLLSIMAAAGLSQGEIPAFANREIA